jgi:GNAT superfamily N-acetyltransferase
VNTSELAGCVERCLEGEVRMFGAGSPGARVLELPGLIAGSTPVTPDRSLFNSVYYRDAAAVTAAWPELEHSYGSAGVRAWTVWVRPGDATLMAELAQRGHKPDGRVIGMAAPLAELSLPEPGELDWRQDDDCRAVGALNDASYTLALPAFGAAMQGFDRGGMPASVRPFVARLAGRDVACVCSHDEPDGVLGISAVATLPEARGQGLASRLLAVALRDGARRGLRATSLIASSLGRGVYARLGYQAVSEFEMWERRQARIGALG